MTTKKELIVEFKKKTQKAHPWVKKIAYSGLKHKTKDTLENYIKNARVTTHGDISFVK